MSFQKTIDILNKVRFGVVSVGLVGNFITFAIFSRQSFQKNSINVYCRALALVDSIILLFQFVGDVNLIFYNVNLYWNSNTLCKISTYVFVALPPVSGWIIVAFSLDKLISVLAPNRYEFIQKRSVLFSIISFIVIFNALLYSEIPIDLDLTQTLLGVNGSNQTVKYQQCQLQELSYYRVINILYLVEGNFIPFLFMISTTVIITRTLVSSHNRLELYERRVSREMKSRRNRDLKFSLSSIFLNVLYVLLQFPIALTYLISFDDQSTYYIFYLSTAIFYFMNFSIPFFAYLISNSIFRREILCILGIKSELSSVHVASASINRKDTNTRF